MVGATYGKVFVNKSISNQIGYPSKAGVFLIQATGDLVLATTNSDGVFIVEKVLCAKGSGYSDCRDNYNFRLYDAISGKELSYEFEIKENGIKIDPKTYHEIKED